MKIKDKIIVQLSSVHHSYDTRIYHKICKSLIENGYKVDLIIQHECDEIRDGVNVIALPIAKKKIDRLTKVLPTVLKKVNQYPKGTIIHFHDPELIPFGYLFKLLGYKVVYDVHEDVPASIKSKSWIPKWLRIPVAIISSWFEKIAVILFDGIIVVVTDVGERLKSTKTIMVQNFPILKDDVRFAEYKSDGNLFYVGDISRIRGAHEMVDLAEDISHLNIKKNLVLAGKFSPPSLENELKEKNGWGNTTYIGWINREELNKQLQNSCLGLVLLYPEPHHIRSQPNKLFEYMYGGIPIVSADLPRYKEIIDEVGCGVTVNPLNRESILEGVKYILENPALAAKMGERGRKAVIERFNWDIEKMKLFKFYEELI